MDTTLLNPEEITLYQLRQENEELRVRLAQAEQMLADIRNKEQATDSEVDSKPQNHIFKSVNSDRHLRKMYDSDLLGILYWNTKGEITRANDKFLQMVGYTREDLENGKIDWIKMTPPEYLYLDEKSLVELKTSGSMAPFEKEYIRKDGSRLPILISGALIDDEISSGVAFILDISKRRKVESNLKESENRFSKAFNYSPMGINIFQLSDGRSVQVNQAYLSLIGYSEEEVIGHTSIELNLLVHPEDRDKWLAGLQEGRTVQNLELLIRKKSGQQVNVLMSLTLIEINGERMGLIQTVDISERMKAEEILQKSEKEFRLLTESMPQIVWTTTADGQNTYFNHQWVEYTGLTLDESYGHGWNKPFHPDDQQRAWDAWQNAVQHNAEYLLQCRLRRFDGVYRWWLIHGVPVIDKNGTITKWYGTCTDIDEMKNAGDAILHNEALLRSVIENVSSGVALIDETGKFVVYNPVFLKLFGLSPDSTIKNVNDQDWSQWQVFDENKNLLQLDDHPVRKAVLTGKLVKNQLVAMKLPAGGDYIWMLITAEPLLKEDGSIDKIICTYHDITEQKLSEEAMHDSELRYKSLFQDNYSVMLLIHPETGEILDANPAACRYYGWSKAEICSRKISEINTLTPQEVAAEMQKAKEEERNHFFFKHRLSTGEIRDVEVYSGPIQFGENVMLYSLVHDISDRKIAEEALKQSEERYKSIFRKSMSVMLLINPDTAEIMDVNQAACDFYGYPYSDFCGKNLTDLNLLTKEHTISNLQNTKLEIQNKFTYKHRLANNEVRNVEIYSSPLEYNGSIALFAIIHDITERTKLEEALRESEYFFKESQRAASIGSYKTDFVNNIWESSEVLDQIFGINNDYNKSLGGWLDLIHPVDRVVMNQYILNEVLSKGSEFNYEYRIIRQSDGEVRWVLGLGKVGYDENNNVISLVGTIQDITERKVRENALSLSEQRLEVVFNGVKETILLVDINGVVLISNHTAAERWGLSVKDIIGYNIFGYNDPAMKAKRELQVNEMIETRKPVQFEEPFKDKIFDLTFYPIIEPSGEINQFVIIHRDVTAIKMAEQVLLESEEKFRTLVFDMQVGVLLQGPKAEILLSNPKALELLGLTEDQLLGKTSFDPDWNVIHEDGTPFPGETHPVAVAIATGKPVMDVVMGVYNPSINERLWLLVHAVPQIGDDGKLQQVVCTFIDISELKKAENEVKESAEKFRNLVYDMQVGVLLNGQNSEILLANPKALELLGLTEDQITGKTPYDPDWRPIHEDGTPFPGETHPAAVVIATHKAVKNVVMGIYQPLRGEHAWFLINAQPQLDNDGELIQVVTTFVEITELREAQRELRESELRLKYHFENSPLGVVEWNSDFVVTQWSVEAERIFGYTKEEAIGKPIGDLNLIYEEDLPIVNHTIQRLTSGEEDTVVSSNRNVTKSGSIITTVWYNSVLFDENRKMNSVISLVQDITIQKKAEELLINLNEELDKGIKERTAELVISNENIKIAEEKYRTVADFTYNMETWMDSSGKYIYVSPSSYKITGYTADEFMEDPALFTKIAHPDDREMVENHFKEDMTGTVLKGALEFRIITKSGVERWIGHSCQPVYDTEGKLLGQRGSNRNITKQKHAELVLIESEKNLRLLTQRMDEVAEEERIRISREIHDEIGHLLTALKYDTEGLLSHTNLSAEQVKEELTGMVSMIEALIDTVRKIATELRPGILDHMGLIAAIEWKIKQFRLKNKICCEYEIEEMDMKFTKNETTFIYRILQEIFTNVTRHAKATNMWVAISYKDGNFIMKVSDNGVGFDIQSGLQKGSLGLRGMIERAKSIGGEILLESEPGKGTTTTLILKK